MGFCSNLKCILVTTIRFELTRLATPPPQDGESTNFSTWPESKKPGCCPTLVTRLGLEPRTPTLKVLCSTN
jgi:hypothetical protein